MEYIFYDYKQENELLEFLITQFDDENKDSFINDLQNIFPKCKLYLIDFEICNLGIYLFINRIN